MIVTQVLNLSDISKKCGISQPTAKAWISILESSYIIYLLPPYFKNFSKRIIKSPKLYFYDSGLLCHLLGRGTSSYIEGQDIKGHLFENMIVSEYIKQRAHNEHHTQLYYWRDSNKNEVDLVLEHNNQITLSEIKSTATIRQKLFKNLKEVASLFPSEVKKELVYTGRKQYVRSEIQIVPWHEVAMRT